MKITFCLTPLLVILLFQGASALGPVKKQIAIISPWEIGFSGGVSSFVTSVNPDAEVTGSSINYWNRNFNPGIGLFVMRNVSPALGVELNWLNTHLTGTWNNKYPPLPYSAGFETPLTFNSDINQFDLMLAFNVNQIMLPGDEEDLWHLFLKTGVGIAHIKDNKNFFPGDSPYTKLSLALNAGLSVSLNENIKLLAGSTFRFVNTDNLDGVHVTTTDMNGQGVSWMKVYEIYHYSYLGVSYRLGDTGSKKSNSNFRKKGGKSRNFRRR